jgi:hypothetical protein
VENRGQEPTPAPQALRRWYALLQTSSAAVLVGLSVITWKFDEIYRQMEMHYLPLPTEVAVAWSRFIRWPVGFSIFAVFVIVVILLAQRGLFDRFLKKLILGNVLAIAIMIPFWVLAVYMPIVKIQQTLEK